MVWYDINCKFAGYFWRWAQRYGPLLSVLRALPFGRTQHPVPCFHRYSHRCGMHLASLPRAMCSPWRLLHPCTTLTPTHACPPMSPPCSAACQEKNDGLYIAGTGRQYNEPNETFWAYMGQLGITTQVGVDGQLGWAGEQQLRSGTAWRHLCALINRCRSVPMLPIFISSPAPPQYMTHRNRWGRLERGAQLYNDRQADRIVPLLQSMMAKAQRAQVAAAEQQTDVLRQLQEYHGIPPGQVDRLWFGGRETEGGERREAAHENRRRAVLPNALPWAQPPPPPIIPPTPFMQAEQLPLERAASIQRHSQPEPRPPPRAEYALLRLQREYVSPQPSAAAAPCLRQSTCFGAARLNAWRPALRRCGACTTACACFAASSLPAESPRWTAPTLRRQSQSLRCSRSLGCKRLSRAWLSRRVAWGVRASPCHARPRLRLRLACACACSPGAQHLPLLSSPRQVQLMEQLMQQLTGRPGEQAKTRRSKQALKQRMQPDLNCLLRWLGGGYAGFHLLPTAVQQRAVAAANADDWTAGALWLGGLHCCCVCLGGLHLQRLIVTITCVAGLHENLDRGIAAALLQRSVWVARPIIPPIPRSSFVLQMSFAGACIPGRATSALAALPHPLLPRASS